VRVKNPFTNVDWERYFLHPDQFAKVKELVEVADA